MCTAIGLVSGDHHHFFGRTMDICQEFGQHPLVVPRNYNIFSQLSKKTWSSTYGILGMGLAIQGHPMLAEGMNEKGLACASLNFPHYAHYEESPVEGKENLQPFDLILWTLAQFSTVAQVKEALRGVELVGQPFMPDLPVPPLHWMFQDAQGKSIVVEKTKEKWGIYDNPVGVMANSPSFDWHLTHLNLYTGLSNRLPVAQNWGDQTLAPQGDGLGLHGLAGDSYSTSRFLRAAYLRNHIQEIDSKEEALAGMFHIFDNLAMVSGSVITDTGALDKTLYASAMDLTEKVYYYSTYQNRQLSAIRLEEEYLAASEIQEFSYQKEQRIAFQTP